MNNRSAIARSKLIIVPFTHSQGGESVDDTRAALWTLGEVLLSLTKMMSPFTPFFSGRYRNVSIENSASNLMD